MTTAVARAARGEIGRALGADVRAWRWSRRLSLLIDLWLALEEREP